MGATVQVLLVLTGIIGQARAQGFDGQRYVPPAGAAGGLLVERAWVPHHLGASGGLVLDFADDPVVVSDPNDGEVLSRPVDTLVVLDLVGSIALFDRLELALDVPVVPLYQGEDLWALVAAPGVGDVRFVPKLLVLGSADEDGLLLGAALPISFPTGDAEALRGAGEPWLEPKVLLGLRGKAISVHGSGGFRARPGLDDLDPIGNEITFGAAVAFAAIGGDTGLDLLVEGSGATDLTRSGPQLTDVPLEALAGLEWRPDRDWTLTAGAGPGLTDGLGTPNFRAVAGVRFAPKPDEAAGVEPVDTDGDKILDPSDACPTVPEDDDGFEDKDGCPEEDNDQDGVLDDKDECPQNPEEPGGDGDGCPEKVLVRLGSDRLEVDGKILFATNSADIDPRSAPLLDEIARLLRTNTEVERVIIQGHTDSVGEEVYNDDLSQRRAASVRAALMSRGISGERLEPKGYGERRPIAPNDTPAGRASNRRVEFVLKE